MKKIFTHIVIAIAKFLVHRSKYELIYTFNNDMITEIVEIEEPNFMAGNAYIKLEVDSKMICTMSIENKLFSHTLMHTSNLLTVVSFKYIGEL